ncbi:MAG: hypothetical protein JWM96_347 [Alphaproteobacteria bacterium]|nr:hypothetical protein [Alphaproteobacteria bacterium]
MNDQNPTSAPGWHRNDADNANRLNDRLQNQCVEQKIHPVKKNPGPFYSVMAQAEKNKTECVSDADKLAGLNRTPYSIEASVNANDVASKIAEARGRELPNYSFE